MHPTSLQPYELSALTALGQAPRPRPEYADRIVGSFKSEVAREVAGLHLEVRDEDDASAEAQDIAYAIRTWVAENRAASARRLAAAG